ncbi:hypothetical protein B0O99DRAFT_607068 [Bisporella sp. PMI_857]|nr:hypothetical protein B0O99DRAFT_607068 [Bisporella sp. PMI_857]
MQKTSRYRRIFSGECENLFCFFSRARLNLKRNTTNKYCTLPSLLITERMEWSEVRVVKVVHGMVIAFNDSSYAQGSQLCSDRMVIFSRLRRLYKVYTYAPRFRACDTMQSTTFQLKIQAPNNMELAVSGQRCPTTFKWIRPVILLVGLICLHLSPPLILYFVPSDMHVNHPFSINKTHYVGMPRSY